jgi:MFS family permease
MGQAMGYVAMATSLGSLSGPLLGGVVYARAGYYAVFAMGFAIIGVDILLRVMMVEKSAARQWLSPTEDATANDLTSQDPPGVEIKPMPAIKNLRDGLPLDLKKATSPKLHKRHPASTPNWTQRLPPVITLLRIPRLLVSLFGCFVQATTNASFDSVLPLFVKNTFSWNSTGAGLIFICLVVPALFSPVVGIISDRCGARVITTVGLLGAVPFWVLLRLVTYDSIAQKALLCSLLALIGLFMALVMAPLMAEIDHGTLNFFVLVDLKLCLKAPRTNFTGFILLFEQSMALT